jgi:hypothetical protein
MIKELAWYMEDNRFTSLVSEFQTVMDEYAEAKQNGDADTEAKREKVRRLYEEHAVQSGYRNEDNCFINVDTEFFEGNSLNQKALNTFMKEIIKSHCYQKNLWTYMGTTGNLTIISRTEMEQQGQKYEDYLPVSYKKTHPQHTPIESYIKKGEVPFFMYGDGTVSQTYDKAKAKLRFDTLQDKSGFDWSRKGYDPNYEVQKDGWHGAFDKDGSWVRVNDKELKKMKGAVTAARPQPLELIKTGRDTAILYDPGFIMLNPTQIYYLTDTDDVYGAAETSAAEMTEQIQAAMKQLGVTHIESAAGYGKNVTDKKQHEETALKYRKILGELASDTFTITDGKTAEQQKEINKKTETEKERITKSISLQKTIAVLADRGTTGNALYEAALTGKAEVPLSIRDSADRNTAGITDEEYSVLETYDVPEEAENSFSRMVMNLAALKKNTPEPAALIEAGIEHNAGSTGTLYEKAYEKAVQHKNLTDTVNTETSFGALCAGKVTSLPCTAPSEEITETLEKAAAELPVQDTPAKEEAVHTAVRNVITYFTAVQMSTGMTPEEAVTEAVKAVHGRTGKPFVPPVTGQVQNVQKTADKRIFFEFTIDALMEQAERTPCMTKKVPVTALMQKDNTDTVPLTLPRLDSREGLEQYMESTEFARSGLTAEQLTTLIQEKMPGGDTDSPEANERSARNDSGTAEAYGTAYIEPVYRQKETAHARGMTQTGTLHNVHQAVFYPGYETEHAELTIQRLQRTLEKKTEQGGDEKEKTEQLQQHETAVMFSGEGQPFELLHSTGGYAGGITLAALSGLTAERLVREYGWTAAEAQTAQYTLRTYSAAEEQAAQYKTAAPLIEQAVRETKTAAALSSRMQNIAQTLHGQAALYAVQNQTAGERPAADEGYTFDGSVPYTEDGEPLTLPAQNALPALLHNTQGFEDDTGAVPVAVLAGITADTLVKDYGYDTEEAEASLKTLGNYALPKVQAAHYESIAPDLTAAIGSGKTVKTLRRNMKKLAETINKRAKDSSGIMTEQSAWNDADTVMLSSPAGSGTVKILHNTQGFEDGGSAVPLMQLAGITPDTLVKDYGYEPEEAEASVRTLGNYALPKVQAAHYESIAPDLTAAIGSGKTVKTLRRNMRKFAETINKREESSENRIAAVPDEGQNYDTVQLTTPARSGALTLLHSTDGFNGGSTVSLSQLAGITPDTLISDYGYAPEEAAEAVRTLGSYALPQVQSSRYNTIAPQITHLLSQGKTAETFRNNISRFADSYSMPQHAGSMYAPDTEGSPGMTPFMQLFGTPQGKAVPLSFGRGSHHAYTDTIPSGLQEPGGYRGTDNPADMMQTETAGSMQGKSPAIEGIMSGSAFTNTSVPESVHAAKTSPHLYNNMPVDTPSVTPEDREEARMARINANYEHDRAALAREKAPALARSDTHDVGHAEGMEESDKVTDPKKLGKKLTMQLIDRAKGVIL